MRLGLHLCHVGATLPEHGHTQGDSRGRRGERRHEPRKQYLDTPHLLCICTSGHMAGSSLSTVRFSSLGSQLARLMSSLLICPCVCLAVAPLPPPSTGKFLPQITASTTLQALNMLPRGTRIECCIYSQERVSQSHLNPAEQCPENAGTKHYPSTEIAAARHALRQVDASRTSPPRPHFSSPSSLPMIRLGTLPAPSALTLA